MEALAPVVRRNAPGVDEAYDTLDDIILARSTVEELYQRLEYGLKGSVGISFCGENTLSTPTDGHWGRAISLPTGEHIQLRILPRGSFGVPLGPNDFRLIATRRTSHNSVPVVGCAIVFLPRDAFTDPSMTPLVCGNSIGCRGIHVVLPSLFDKHDPHRDKKSGGAQMDVDGYHSVRPASVLIPQNCDRKVKHGGDFALTAGDSYLVLAGHMAGVDVPDGLRRCSETLNSGTHSRSIVAKQRKLIQSLGEQEAGVYIFSALTLCELISAEGYVSILCNSFFYGALSDMAFSPVGVPLSLCLAVHIACFPERFGVQKCTKSDAFSNKEVMFAFHSRWKRVLLNGFRALDVAIKSAYDRALAETEGQAPLKMQLEDSMVLWQRIGQRLISKVMSDPRDEVNKHSSQDVYSTRFGTSDLVKDNVTFAKYDALAKKGFCKPVVESPVDKIYLAPRSDQRTTLYRILDNAEGWLRTGMFGEIRISKENVNVAPASTCRDTRLPCPHCGTCFMCACKFIDPDVKESANTDTSSSDESDDVDDLMDNKLNVSALETAAGALATSMIHGPFSQHSFGIKSFLLGPGAKNKCADCDEDVSALQALLFGSKSDQCQLCNRRRCLKCANDALKASKSPSSCCLRCDPAAPRVRTKLVEPSKSPNKKSSKK